MAPNTGVDLSDYLVDRENCSDKIICKDNSVDHPCGNRCSFSVKSEDLGSSYISRGVDKYGAYQQEQQAAEYLIEGVYTFVAVYFS